MTEGAATSGPATLSPFASTVSVKPAQFSSSSPTAWFAILEAQFHLASITSVTTQFFHALAHLPPETVSRLPESILSGKDYELLKAAVVSYHEQSKPELFDEFMRSTPLVGRPSHFLAEMKRVAAKVGVSDELVRYKFQQAVPQSMAPILASQKGSSLDDLGKLADELLSLCPVSSGVNSVAQATSQTQRSLRHEGTNASGSKNLGLTPYRPEQRPRVCRAHIFYGKSANTCRPWCQWPTKDTCRVMASRGNTPNQSRSASPNRAEN